jgi:hypothetical protein
MDTILIPVSKVRDWQRLLRALGGQVSHNMRAGQGKVDTLFTLENMVNSMEELLKPADPVAWITSDGKCSQCGHKFDFDDLKALGFVAEEGGVSSVPGEPTVHWAAGYILCPDCGEQLPYEVSD